DACEPGDARFGNEAQAPGGLGFRRVFDGLRDRAKRHGPAFASYQSSAAEPRRLHASAGTDAMRMDTADDAEVAGAVRTRKIGSGGPERENARHRQRDGPGLATSLTASGARGIIVAMPLIETEEAARRLARAIAS